MYWQLHHGHSGGPDPALGQPVFVSSGGKFGLLTALGRGRSSPAFLVEADGKGGIDVGSTAQPSALLVTPFAGPSAPEISTWAMFIAGFGIMGAMGWRRKSAVRCAL